MIVAGSLGVAVVNTSFPKQASAAYGGKQGSFKEYEQAAKLAGYGPGAEKTADVLSKDVRTIDVWLGEIAGKSRLFHLWLSAGIGLVIRFLQLDELWSYVTRKDRQCWVFAALDVPSRFWIGFVLGKRTYRNAKRMLDMVFSLGNWSSRRMLRITSDKLAAYKKAIGICFKDLQIVKRRYKRRLVIVKKEFVKGEDKDFPGKTQNTSFIERLNLTIRQWCPFLKRKTLGYCKKENALSDALWINLFHYITNP